MAAIHEVLNAFAGDGVDVVQRAAWAEAALFRGVPRIARASGCSERCSRAAARARTSSSVDRLRVDGGDARFAFGEGAGFVEDEGVDARQPLDAFAAFEEDAELGTRVRWRR